MLENVLQSNVIILNWFSEHSVAREIYVMFGLVSARKDV